MATEPKTEGTEKKVWVQLMPGVHMSGFNGGRVGGRRDQIIDGKKVRDDTNGFCLLPESVAINTVNRGRAEYVSEKVAHAGVRKLMALATAAAETQQPEVNLPAHSRATEKSAEFLDQFGNAPPAAPPEGPSTVNAQPVSAGKK